MIIALIQLIGLAAKIYTLLIIGRVVLSWVSPEADNPLVGFVYRVTEPVLRPVRSILPVMGGFDLSPILALIGIQIAEELVVRALIGFTQG